MEGNMHFVYTVEVDNDQNRRLSYQGALSQLNQLLDSGMEDGTFLDQDVPVEDRIITGMTFIPENSGGKGDSWGTAGTAPIKPGQGLENIPETESTPPDEVIPIGPSPDQPISSTKGRAGSVSYGFYGLFAIIAIVVVIVGIIVRRRRNDEEEDEAEEGGVGSVSSSSSIDEGKAEGDSPAYDLSEVKEVGSDEIDASANDGIEAPREKE